VEGVKSLIGVTVARTPSIVAVRHHLCDSTSL
jgi:hypothetical protein